ncbi:MAG: hypothetical protein GY851_20365 [bacterium]|nr:hypothetical protein [bacterium]
MKVRFGVVLCVAVMLVSVGASAEFKAGAAMRILTPEKDLAVSGGTGASRAATEVQDDLTARVLVLENGDTRVAMCSVDFLGFPGVLVKKVAAQVPGVPAENILIGSTHTHSAPDMYGMPKPDGTTDADLEYIDWVCARTAEAINEAVANLEPASLKIATDKAAERISYNYYAPKLYDRRCHVIQALNASGKPISTLVNYATHPEVIGSGQGAIGPDLCGPFYDRIEEKGGGVAVFMNSAQGGMVTADCRGEDGKDIQTWDECIRIGNLLADEAIRIVADAPVQENPNLYCAATTISFPIETPVMQFILAKSPLGYEMGDDGTVPARVNLMNLGNAQILTIPGEALPNIGFYLKRKMHGEHNLLFGLTNEALGYMLTKEDYKSFPRYDYVSRVCLGEMTGDIYINAALKFADASPRPAALDN